VRDREAAETETLRELAKAIDDLFGDLPPLQKYRRDRSGKIGYTPHTLSLFRTACRKLNDWKRFKREEKEENNE